MRNGKPFGQRMLGGEGGHKSEALKVIKIIANVSPHSWGVYYGPEPSPSLYVDELMTPSHQRLERDYAIVPYFTDEETESQRGKELAPGHPNGRLQNQLSSPELRGRSTFS